MPGRHSGQVSPIPSRTSSMAASAFRRRLRWQNGKLKTFAFQSDDHAPVAAGVFGLSAYRGALSDPNRKLRYFREHDVGHTPFAKAHHYWF
jgi:hypothetical protein